MQFHQHRSSIVAAQADTLKKGSDLGSLRRLGFESLAECLLTVPKDFLDFTQPTKIIDPRLLGERRYFVLQVQECRVLSKDWKVCTWGSQAKAVIFKCSDARESAVDVPIFDAIWPWRNVEPGHVIHVLGELTQFRDQLQIKMLRSVQPHERGKIAAIYPGKPGQVRSETVGEKIAIAAPHLEEAGFILLARAGLRQADFPTDTGFTSAVDLLRALHQPKTLAEGANAVQASKRLAEDAMVRLATAARVKIPNVRSAILIKSSDVEELISWLPFTLTDDQRRSIDEIVGDLRAPYPMRRLLSGDVNTGKSAVFNVAAAAAHRVGAKVAIVAPSVLVVRQLATDLRTHFKGIPVCEVTEKSKPGDGILVGTTALLNAAKKQGLVIDLMITDEQQKFSVDQKASAVAPHTNVLEATATAIPRTVALVAFGGMDQSTLKQLGVKKHISTHITSEANDEDMARLDSYLKEALARGLQIAVIYPQVATPAKANEEQAENLNDEDAYKTVQAATHRWEAFLPGKVAGLHGRMSVEEKNAAIERMNSQDAQILVASTVIEVGVTLPSLKAMVVVNPERYGLSQLHQLRGRLARKGGHGRMFLHLDDAFEAVRERSPEVIDRLQLLVECQDGFELAERDMQMRGFGDVQAASRNQSGTARALFWGVNITPAGLKEAAERLGVSI